MLRKALTISQTNPLAFYDDGLFKEQLTVDIEQNEDGWGIMVEWEYGAVTLRKYRGDIVKGHGFDDMVPSDPDSFMAFWVRETKRCIREMLEEYMTRPHRNYTVDDYLADRGAWMIGLDKEAFHPDKWWTISAE